jgi:hypothetical protein
MNGLTDYLTEQLWEDTIIATYLIVSDHLSCAYQVSGFARTRGPDPAYDDAQIITIALVAEFWFAGHEELALHFLRQYHPTLWSNGLPDTARFNVRRRALQEVLEALRALLRDVWRQRHPLAEASDSPAEADLATRLRIVDSAPVVMVSRGRGGRTPTLAPESRADWFGVCTSQHFKFFGGRVHTTVTLDQMIDEWLVAPGSYVDGQVLPALCEPDFNLIYLGDKGYVGEALAQQLWDEGQHLLLALKRDNQLEAWPTGVQRLLGRVRHRVETALSVLTTVFHLRWPQSRSFSGFVARVTTKILAYTLSFFLATPTAYRAVPTA